MASDDLGSLINPSTLAEMDEALRDVEHQVGMIVRGFESRFGGLLEIGKHVAYSADGRHRTVSIVASVTHGSRT